MYPRNLVSLLALSLLTITVLGRATAEAQSPANREDASGNADSQAAREVEAVQEPEYDNEFHYLDPATYILTPLERAGLDNKVKYRAFGMGGVKQSLQVATPSSGVRLKANASLNFVVRGVPPRTIPADVIALFKFTVAGDRRELFMASAGIGGLGAKYRSSEEGKIPFTATKYGTSSVRITPAQPLQPGEYVFVMAPAQSGYGANVPSHGYCFGVDPP